VLGYCLEANARGTSFTFPVWLRLIAQKQATTVEAVDYNGTPTIRMLFSSDHSQLTVLISPSADDMPVRMESNYRQGSRFNSWYNEVTGTKEVNGVRIPSKSVFSTSSSAAKWKTEEVTEVQGFTIGNVQPNDIEIAFTVGTEVMDAIGMTSYFIRVPGRYELRPIADSSAHVAYVPPKPKTYVMQIDDKTHCLYV
jgi:hypothetical protein